MAFVFDKLKSVHSPFVEGPMLKGVQSKPPGIRELRVEQDTFTLDVGPILIEMSRAEMEDLVSEWSLCDRLRAEWRAKGNSCDPTTSEFLDFLGEGHRQ